MSRDDFEALIVGDKIHGDTWGTGTIIGRYQDCAGTYFLVQHEKRPEAGCCANPDRWSKVNEAVEVKP